MDFLKLMVLFQPTLSAWRATIRGIRAHVNSHISIHALRVESDSKNGEKENTSPLFLQQLDKYLMKMISI